MYAKLVAFDEDFESFVVKPAGQVAASTNGETGKLATVPKFAEYMAR